MTAPPYNRDAWYTRHDGQEKYLGFFHASPQEIQGWDDWQRRSVLPWIVAGIIVLAAPLAYVADGWQAVAMSIVFVLCAWRFAS